MTTIHASIDVRATPHELYESWSRYEDYPRFMQGVERVSREELDGEAVTAWAIEIEGQRVEFEARVAEDVPDRRIAWTSVGDGAAHSGVVTFHRIDDAVSRVIVEMDYAPEGLAQRVGDLLGLPGNLLERNLERFKRWVEEGATLEDDPSSEPSASAFAQRSPSGLV